MSDLISRSELLKRFSVSKDGHRIPERDCDNFEVTMSIKDVKTIIKEQPTAYSVDNIVDELETDSSVKLYGSGNSDNYLIPVKRAIEIVKQCDFADDVCEWKLEDKEANLYLTGCQQRQLIFEGTPKENEYRYCPYCGKKIKIVGD